MPRGRPIGSEIRQRMVDILAVMGQGYGYEIHKIYCELFPRCTREVVYYHLRIGVKLGQFIIEKVVSEQGDYSWGRMVEKTYYKLGPEANPRANYEIHEYFKKKKESKGTGLEEKQTPEMPLNS